MVTRVVTRQEIEAAVDCNGRGATRELLLSWGVKWPPKKGWKKELLKRADAASGRVALKESKRKAPVAPKSTKSKSFYQTAAWKRLRFEAFEALGRKCGCCGWTPDSGGINYLVVDHIKSRKLRPDLELALSNLQVLCNECNLGKGSFSASDYRRGAA